MAAKLTTAQVTWTKGFGGTTFAFVAGYKVTRSVLGVIVERETENPGRLTWVGIFDSTQQALAAAGLDA